MKPAHLLLILSLCLLTAAASAQDNPAADLLAAGLSAESDPCRGKTEALSACAQKIQDRLTGQNSADRPAGPLEIAWMASSAKTVSESAPSDGNPTSPSSPGTLGASGAPAGARSSAVGAGKPGRSPNNNNQEEQKPWWRKWWGILAVSAGAAVVTGVVGGELGRMTGWGQARNGLAEAGERSDSNAKIGRLIGATIGFLVSLFLILFKGKSLQDYFSKKKTAKSSQKTLQTEEAAASLTPPGPRSSPRPTGASGSQGTVPGATEGAAAPQ
ncbi:MAG: hypothetical protein A3G41_02925 [Elusimicrobia bacterium RIFCSPLOWO2_12_FULL_59_9]|nr:MAG: hypothetical protein A3G41_02925 [Elusimicrobia bacterium RIFCSPLOWO2_12_FULL_59_9]